MKSKLFSIFWTLLLIPTLHLPQTFAEYANYTPLGLPEGAKARFGKGWISETAYSAIAYAPNSTRLAVASSIGIWIYDVETGETLDLLVGHKDVVHSVAFSPDGKTIVSGSSDRMVRLWEANTGDLLHTLMAHTYSVKRVVFSPDGETVISGSRDRTMCLWETDTGDLLHTLIGHVDSVNSMAFSPDGRTLVSGSPDGTVLLWELTPESVFE